MRAFSVVSLLCGAATVVQAAITSFSVPSVIAYSDRVINVTFTGAAEPTGISTFPLSVLFGFDDSDGAKVTPEQIGGDLGWVDISRPGAIVGGVLSLQVAGSSSTWTKGQFKLIVSTLVHPGASMRVQIFSAEVSYGPTRSTTTTQGKLVGNLVYAAP